MAEFNAPGDKNRNSTPTDQGKKKDLTGMRFRNTDMFTSGGKSEYSSRDKSYSDRLGVKQGGTSDSMSEQSRDVSNPYNIAFLGARPDAVYGSTDPNTSIVRDQRLGKIEKDG